MSVDVARSHGGDGGGEDHPLHTMYQAVAWVAFLTEAAHGIPRLDRDQCGHPVAFSKGIQKQQGCFQGPALGYRPHDRDLKCREDQTGTS
nr:hypothetical protein [Tanacetum cinerariifolium]